VRWDDGEGAAVVAHNHHFLARGGFGEKVSEVVLGLVQRHRRHNVTSIREPA
jgi:hypothetical protein